MYDIGGQSVCPERDLFMTDEQRNSVADFRREGYGYTAIAKKMNLSRDTVRSFCRRNGLSGDMEKLIEQNQEGRCRECGAGLEQRNGVKRRKFCCKECREKWWHKHPDKIKQRAVYSFVCACCGEKFTAYGNSKRKYCSHECYIKARFKGGAECG